MQIGLAIYYFFCCGAVGVCEVRSHVHGSLFFFGSEHSCWLFARIVAPVQNVTSRRSIFHNINHSCEFAGTHSLVFLFLIHVNIGAYLPGWSCTFQCMQRSST